MADKQESPTTDELVNSINLIKEDLLTVHKELADKNNLIDLLSIANTDLINIDMEIISDELHNAQTRLMTIGTVKQFDTLREIEKRKGLNAAYNASKIFLEEGGREANMVIPTLNNIKLNLEKISEKLKYIEEA